METASEIIKRLSGPLPTLALPRSGSAGMISDRQPGHPRIRCFKNVMLFYIYTRFFDYVNTDNIKASPFTLLNSAHQPFKNQPVKTV